MHKMLTAVVAAAVLGTLLSEQSQCPKGYVSDTTGKVAGCYKAVCKTADFLQAKQTCGEHDGSLTTILNKDTNDFVRGLMTTATPLWFYYYSPKSNYSNFAWAPDNEHYGCTFMGKCDTDDDGWYLTNCSKKLPFVCRLNDNATTPWITDDDDDTCTEVDGFPEDCIPPILWVAASIIIGAIVVCGCCLWAFVIGFCICYKATGDGNNLGRHCGCSCTRGNRKYSALPTKNTPTPRLAFYEDEDTVPPIYEMPDIPDVKSVEQTQPRA